MQRILLPWKLPAWSLATAGYFWAGICSSLRGYGVLSWPVTHRVRGGDTEKPLLHMACV